MALAREDRGFAVGAVVVAAVLGLYAVAVRGPLRSATARSDREIRSRQPKVDLYFRNPKATPYTRVERELGKRADDLAQRLASLVGTVEFDPGSLDPTGEAVGGSADLCVLYFKLSEELHERLRAKAEKAPHVPRVPAVFDPQGKKQTPDDSAAVPRLHRQLVMAHRILDAAIDHRVDVTELRAVQPRLLGTKTQPYLDELSVVVTAEAGLDAIAAWLHALSQPPSGKSGSRFLSVGRLEIGAGGKEGKVEYQVTFVSVRVNPKVTLAGPPAKKADEGPRRRRPGRAPKF